MAKNSAEFLYICSFLSADFIDYALSLIQGEPDLPLENGLQKFARLNKVLAK